MPKHSEPNFPPKTLFPKNSYWSMITHVIFYLIGNDLQNQVMTYLWFKIRVKHLPVWGLYTLSDFLLFSVGPSICRSKLHDDESRLIQGVLMITKMMTKSPREWIQDWVKNTSRIKRNLISRFKNQVSRFKFQESRIIKLKIQESRKDSIKISTKKFFKILSSTWIFHKTFYQRVFTLW